jgi:hypothetical protein
MLTVAVKVGQLVSNGLIGAGVVVVAQASAVSDIDRIIGGSVILGSGLLALRMILKAARHERESAATIQKALVDRVTDLETDLVDARIREAELQEKYDSERALRISLERAGVANRRHDDLPDSDDIDGTAV